MAQLWVEMGEHLGDPSGPSVITASLEEGTGESAKEMCQQRQGQRSEARPGSLSRLLDLERPETDPLRVSRKKAGLLAP